MRGRANCATTASRSGPAADGAAVGRQLLLPWALLLGARRRIPVGAQRHRHRRLTLPIDFDDERATFLAHWILDEEARGTRDVNITVDKDGGRWSGLMESATLNRDPKGDTVTVTFKHDYEHLKNVHCAPNPFLPMAVVQFPRCSCSPVRRSTRSRPHCS